MAGEIYLIVTCTPKPDVFEEVLQKLQETAKAVEQHESGTLIYQVFSNKEKGDVVVFQKYKDMEAIQSHRDSGHYKALMDQSVEMLTQPPVSVILKDPVGFARG